MLPLRLSFLRSLRTAFAARGRSRPTPRPAAPVARRVLRCEELEDRTVPRGVIDPSLLGPSPGIIGGGGSVVAPIAQLAPTASVASPTVTSGTPDLVTIVVRRTDGSVP